MSAFDYTKRELRQDFTKTSSEKSCKNQMQKDSSKNNPKFLSNINYTIENINCNYSNYFKGSATQEEVVINFGINQNWEHSPKTQEIDLNCRVILTPLMAKRISLALNKFLQEYEKHHTLYDKELINKVCEEAALATKH